MFSLHSNLEDRLLPDTQTMGEIFSDNDPPPYALHATVPSLEDGQAWEITSLRDAS